MNGQPQQPGVAPAVIAGLITGGLTFLGVVIAQSLQADQFDRKLKAESDQFNVRLNKDLKDSEDLRRRDIEQRAKDFKIKFYEKQMAAYTELCQLASKIAMTVRTQDTDKDFSRLQELLLGDLAVVADYDVYAAAMRFNQALVKMRRNRPGSMPKEIPNRAYDVSLACRRSLMSTFELRGAGGIGDLPGPGEAVGAVVPEGEGK